jgi:glutamyl-tRNA(Gln) amidotransferase subunit D
MGESSDREADDPWQRLRHLPMGQEVEITTPEGRVWRGTLVPSHEMSGERIVQLKLASGYNVGIRVDPADHVVVVPSPTVADGSVAAESDVPRAPPQKPPTDGGPWIALLTTGGTIASRIDYRTGGVRPVRQESELLAFYPGLEKDGPVRIRSVFDRLSEEIGPADWVVLAEDVGRAFDDGARGVVIAHGTDTLAHTAAALSFSVENPPGPVVLVGAQRSPDRPSSDGASNLAAATRLARDARLGEVVVVMHAGLDDTSFAIHRGNRVRKMHSSRRDAFESRNAPPIGRIDESGVHLSAEARPPSGEGLRIDTRIVEDAPLLWFYPGLTPERAEVFVGNARGVILAGTGLGHVSSHHLSWIRRAVERGVFVGMTSQCLEGSADPYVYATGRELRRAGVVYLGDLLPETAHAKMLFGLGRTDSSAELASFLLEDRAGEFVPRHLPERSR